MTRLPPELIQAYQETGFTVMLRSATFDIHLNQPICLEKTLFEAPWDDYALITAYNPYSEKRSEVENSAQHKQLAEVLDQQGYVYYPQYGQHPSNAWEPEPGFFILDITPENAAAIGRRFRQNAIVVGTVAGNAYLMLLQ